jgi:Electron transfer DM13
MHKRKRVVAVVVVLVLVGGAVAWYLFRPERLFVNQRVAEAPPQSADDHSSTILATGKFHSVAHQSKGTATIYRLADGKRVLRLTDFETSNGPAVYVYLVSAPDATDSKTVTEARTLDLGALKGNIGDQNYDLPADADLAVFHSVTIWCKRFSVNFATAPLSPGAQVTAKGQG